MAKRYGGTYSPDNVEENTKGPKKKRPFDGKKPSRVGARSNVLFYVSLPLIWKALGAPPFEMTGYLMALGCLVAAAFLTREGLKAEEAYESRKIARRPAIPRKIFGALLTGAGLAITGVVGYGPAEAALFGVLGAVLHSLAFGFDPLKNKGFEGVDSFQQDRAARAVEEAEKHLAAMRDALMRASDRGAERRLEQFIVTVRAMFRTVEDDPRDLTAARKYLGVYLLGARDATIKYAELYARTGNEEARRSWFDLLDDLEKNFSARNEALLLDNKTDLDIEIEVLRERLAREGVK